MKKRILALLLTLSLAISLAAPALAADGTAQPVTPTPPEWIPADEYLIFPGDEVYLPENWEKVLSLRAEAENGAITSDVPDGVWGHYGSAGYRYEVGLIWLKCAENAGPTTGKGRGTFYLAGRAFDEASDTGQELGILDYQLNLWTFRCYLLYRADIAYWYGKHHLPGIVSHLGITLDDFLNGPYAEYMTEEARAVAVEWFTVVQNQVWVYLDGIEIFTEDDAKPELQNSRIMVPIRGIAELLGADVGWRKETNEAVLTRAGVTIILPIGGSTAQVNGQAVKLDAPSYVSQNRTMVPLRFVAETFGQSVSWDSKTRVVRIAEDKSVAGESNLEAWALPMGAMLSTLNASDKYKTSGIHTFGCYERSARLIVRNDSGKDVSQYPYEYARYFLSSGWGINGRRDLIKTVCRMTAHGHNDSFQEDVAYIKTLTLAEYLKYLSSPSMDSYMFPYTKKLGEKWGDRGILCWDLFRMSNLVQWGYEAGYITYAEALALLEPAAKLLCENFSSWDEAYENYLDGYNWWARNNVLDKDIWETERGQVYQQMKNDPQRADIFDDALFKTGVVPVPGLSAAQILESVRQ